MSLSLYVQIYSFYKDTNQIGVQPTLTAHLNIIYVKVISSNMAPTKVLWVRVSTYEFVESTIQATTDGIVEFLYCLADSLSSSINC